MPDAEDRLALDERLERGELVFFPRCPFPLPEGDDLRFLLGRELDGHSKTVTLFPETGVMGGHRPTAPEEDARLRGLLGEFCQEATAWVGKALPRYRASMRYGPLRYRIAEEKGRSFDARISGWALHVDANSDQPARGDSFLRVFVNLNPEKERIWRTSVGLAALLDEWSDRVREPGEGPPSWLGRLRLRYGRALGVEPPPDVAYDRLMMRLHFFGKEDPYLQERAPSTRWVFPPGSAWVVFSDLVSHAVVSGEHAIDQTFLVPSWAFRDPGRSTRAVIDRYWSGRPAQREE
jgi:hypothetical protein